MAETESHIIEGLRQRNPKVQQLALEQYGGFVWAQVVRLVSATEDAEEVYQDVFIKVFSNIGAYDAEKASLMTWISRIAYNESITFLRRKRQKVIYFEDQEGDALRLSEEEVDATLGKPDEETVQLIQTAIHHLPPDEQALITMFYYDDMSLKEIAFVTESIPTTVASKLSRTRKKLCKIIKQTLTPALPR